MGPTKGTSWIADAGMVREEGTLVDAAETIPCEPAHIHRVLLCNLS